MIPLNLLVTNAKDNYSKNENIIIDYSVQNISQTDLFLVSELHHIYSPYERTIEVGFSINPPKTLEAPYSFSPPRIEKISTGETKKFKISVGMPLKITYFNKLGKESTFEIPMSGPITLYVRQGYGLTAFDVTDPTFTDFLMWQNLVDSVKINLSIY